MSSLKPITSELYTGKYWKKFESFAHTANESICAITASELPLIALNMPIGFLKTEDSFILVAVLGIRNAENLFVDSNGQWLVRYVPALLRAYPFYLIKRGGESDQYVLCIDEDSGQIVEDDSQNAFFSKSGELSIELKDILQFLEGLERDKLTTQGLVKSLQSHSLIEPWDSEFELRSGVHKVEGLYRVNEKALNKLSDEAFLELRQRGALPVAYSQLISMKHIETLANVAEKTSLANPTRGSRDFLSNNDGIISFESIQAQG